MNRCLDRELISQGGIKRGFVGRLKPEGVLRSDVTGDWKLEIFIRSCEKGVKRGFIGPESREVVGSRGARAPNKRSQSLFSPGGVHLTAASASRTPNVLKHHVEGESLGVSRRGVFYPVWEFKAEV